MEASAVVALTMTVSMSTILCFGFGEFTEKKTKLLSLSKAYGME